MAEVFLFAAGALAGFAVLGLGVRPTLEMSGTIEGSSERVLTGALHWFSVGVAIGAVALVAQMPSWAAWPLGSVIATTLFLVCSSLQLAFVSSRSSRE